MSNSCGDVYDVTFDGGTVKEVYHYFGDESAPAVLRLEDQIDEIAGERPYIEERG